MRRQYSSTPTPSNKHRWPRIFILYVKAFSLSLSFVFIDIISFIFPARGVFFIYIFIYFSSQNLWRPSPHC